MLYYHPALRSRRGISSMNSRIRRRNAAVSGNDSMIVISDHKNIKGDFLMENKTKIYTLTTYAIVAALLCIFGPISIPIGPIPVSLTILIICLSVYLVGMKGAVISYCIYLLLGAFGLPVFSGYQGGLAKLAGPTGGYLIGFIPLALISGFFFEKTKGNLIWTVIGMIIGIAVDYVFGTAWFVIQMDCEIGYALSVCVIPFIPIDLAKVVIANILGKLVRKPLLKAGLVS